VEWAVCHTLTAILEFFSSPKAHWQFSSLTHCVNESWLFFYFDLEFSGHGFLLSGVTFHCQSLSQRLCQGWFVLSMVHLEACPISSWMNLKLKSERTENLFNALLGVRFFYLFQPERILLDYLLFFSLVSEIFLFFFSPHKALLFFFHPFLKHFFL
jgi:hypothetical protein